MGNDLFAAFPDLDFDHVREERHERFEAALGIACAAHLRQRDLLGDEYIWHHMRVALAVRHRGAEFACVAIMHDVIEDCPTMAPEVYREFTERVCAALVAITKRQGEDYEAYLGRVMDNKIARVVKLADVRDNWSRCGRLKATKANNARYMKYCHALNILEGAA